jgi:hypothetical protein
MIAKEKYVLVDPLGKQEGRDARGRFRKGHSGNRKGRFVKGQSGNPNGRPVGATRRRKPRSCCSMAKPRR